MSAKPVKSLLHNIGDGVNRQLHRFHRSKKGQKKLFRCNNQAFKLFKRKKEELFLKERENDIVF